MTRFLKYEKVMAHENPFLKRCELKGPKELRALLEQEKIKLRNTWKDLKIARDTHQPRDART
jgi:hypothetical protein